MNAAGSDGIAFSSSLQQPRQQLLDNADAANEKKSSKSSKEVAFHAPSVRNSLKKFVAGEDFDDEEAKLHLSKPVADLFPAATVMVADICGFTAWSRYVRCCL